MRWIRCTSHLLNFELCAAAPAPWWGDSSVFLDTSGDNEGSQQFSGTRGSALLFLGVNAPVQSRCESTDGVQSLA